MKMLNVAYDYCNCNFSYGDIIEILKSNDDIKKQLALIELKSINSQTDANILVFNLTQHSGPIRETTSFKILDLILKQEYRKYFQTEDILKTFVKSITDINPSVSRNAVEIIKYVDDVNYLYNEILKEINITLSNIDETTTNKSYVQNKKNFNLYWNLEAITSIGDNINPCEKLLDILIRTANSNDYTIREKTAKVASLFVEKNYRFSEVLALLKNYKNVYVQRFI